VREYKLRRKRWIHICKRSREKAMAKRLQTKPRYEDKTDVRGNQECIATSWCLCPKKNKLQKRKIEGGAEPDQIG
jgi:hypothetical protein